MILGSRIASWQSGKKMPFLRRLEYVEGVAKKSYGVVRGKLWTHFEGDFSISKPWDCKYFGNENARKILSTQNGNYRQGAMFYSGSVIPATVNKKHYFLSGEKHGARMVIEGNERTYTEYNNVVETNFYLFHTGSASNTFDWANSKLWWLKLYNGSELVTDLIPVMSNDNNPELYDLVSKTFVERHGDFLYGELDGVGGDINV